MEEKKKKEEEEKLHLSKLHEIRARETARHEHEVAHVENSYTDLCHEGRDSTFTTGLWLHPWLNPYAVVPISLRLDVNSSWRVLGETGIMH